MKDFIFLIGTSGIGKTTLGKGLFEHYKGAFVEQNMVSEFRIPENEDPGKDLFYSWVFANGLR